MRERPTWLEPGADLAKIVAGSMAAISSPRSDWQRGAIFRFFASLKLAVVLLAVLIIASIAGTIYESSFDAKVARTYVYGAPWFNLWLILLAANLTVSALSRWPWRKHHVAFLITHLGIITLLTGSLIGRIWGIEGTLTLFKGEAPTNRLLVDEHQLRVHDSDGLVKGFVAEFLHHRPSARQPRNFGTLASGARLSVVDYADAIDGKLNPRPLPDGDKGQLTIFIAGKTKTIDVAQNLGKDFTIEGTPFHGRIENYWADFRIQDGKPVSLSDTPNNPVVVLTIHGRAAPAIDTNAHGNQRNVPTNGGGAPVMNEASAAQNHLTLYVAADDTISYELKSRQLGDSFGKLELNKPLATGWADWQLVIDRVLPHAEQWMDFTPVKTEKNTAQLPDGVRVRVEHDGETFDQWLPAGWQIAVPTLPKPIGIAYGWRTVPLPIGLELLDFEVTRNEGSDAPAGFKSSLRISGTDGETANGQCWMNHPFSFPSAWWRTWSGLTFKSSQASSNLENLSQSTVKILRDPGWLLKWIGSVLVVAGVFMMFYVKKFRRESANGSDQSRNLEPRLRPQRV